MKPSYLSLTDLFCGAGGASIGAELAGVKLVLGVNHWARAVETHSQNFPHAAHDCRNVSDTHPSRYGSTHLLWASPECTTLSQARGKKRNYTGQLPLDEEFEALPTEAEEKSRVHPLDVVRFAEFHRYEAVVVENVVEECLWGLLPQWFQMMEALGYAHRTLFLNSMFFGVPQSRDRVYFVFTKKGNRVPDLDFRPVAWCPKCAANIEAVQSFKKGCAPTRRYGLRQQYVYVCPACAGTALPYVTPAATAIDWSVLGGRIGDRQKPLAEATMRRIQAGIDRYWNRPVVFDELRDSKHRDALVAPLATQTGRQSQALYIPLIAHLRGTEAAHLAASARPATDPMRTISAAGKHHGLVSPLTIRNFSGGAEMSRPVEEPLGSITAVDHHSLLNPPLVVQAAGNTYERKPGSCRVRATDDSPLWTLPGTVETALLTSYYSREHATRPAGEPMATVSSEPRHGLVTRYYGGSTVNRDVSEPMPTFSTIEGHGLVASDEPVRIEDCSFRMLMPPEIGRGMAFDDEYVVGGTQRERVQQYGQAVTPPVATWIWRRVIESLE